jgi:hypothetical protein
MAEEGRAEFFSSKFIRKKRKGQKMVARFRWLLLLSLIAWNGLADGLPADGFLRMSAAAETSERVQQTGMKNRFKVGLLLPPGGLYIGRNDLSLRVSDMEGRAVEGASISVLPLLHRHGEGTGVRPKVTEQGKGLYGVENVYLPMKGNWDLKITVRKEGVEDEGTFSFPNVDRRP